MTFRFFSVMIFISIFLFCGRTLFAEEETPELVPLDEIVMPTETTDWNDRYIFTEIQRIRTNIDTMKQEIYADIQKREISIIDRALSYSANTLNYFFILLTIVIMGLGLVGWKAIANIKEVVKQNMEKEVEKILLTFQAKMEQIESDQQLNILWRSFSFAERPQEKLDLLDQIKKVKPDSRQMLIEKGNVYLEMELYSQCIEASKEVLLEDSDHSHTIFNRAVSYMHLGEKEKTLEDIEHLLKISPDYRESILEDEIFQDIWSRI